MSIWETISETPVAIWVGESIYGFALLEGMHLIGVALLFGSILMLDLRLIGVSRGLSFEWTRRHILPVSWVGFALILFSGLGLFAVHADLYVLETSFRLKLGLIVLGGVNMVAFEGLIRRGADTWDQFRQTPFAARASGFLSIAVWFGAIVYGRWMGYEKDYVMQFTL
jgi:hypothetical protein